MQFIHAREKLSTGDIVVVSCSHQCNVRLMDDPTFNPHRPLQYSLNGLGLAVREILGEVGFRELMQRRLSASRPSNNHKRLVTLSVLVLLTLASPAGKSAAAGPKPTTPIRHVVVIYDENISFDHYFW